MGLCAVDYYKNFDGPLKIRRLWNRFEKPMDIKYISNKAVKEKQHELRADLLFISPYDGRLQLDKNRLIPYHKMFLLKFAPYCTGTSDPILRCVIFTYELRYRLTLCNGRARV